MYVNRLLYIFPLLWLICFTSQTANAQHSREVTFSDIPMLTQDFEEMRKELEKTPEGTFVLFILALKIYEHDKVQGIESLISVLDPDIMLYTQGKNSYKGYELPQAMKKMIDQQIQKYPFLPNAYFPGTTYQNKYQLGLAPYTISFEKRLYSGSEYSGKVKYFIKANGSKRVRSISARKADGRWVVNEFKSMLAGVKPPMADQPE